MTPTETALVCALVGTICGLAGSWYGRRGTVSANECNLRHAGMESVLKSIDNRLGRIEHNMDCAPIWRAAKED